MSELDKRMPNLFQFNKHSSVMQTLGSQNGEFIPIKTNQKSNCSTAQTLEMKEPIPNELFDGIKGKIMEIME